MDTILITGNDFAAVAPARAAAEALGLTALHANTTENAVEDVLLNDVAIVITQINSQPFDAWETCAILRGDPSVPRGLSLVLLHQGDFDARRFENSGFDARIAANASAAEWTELLVQLLSDSYNALAKE